jgi:hypothetical protein
MRPGRAVYAVTVAAVLAVACDSGPGGPGTLVASVTGNSLGGVVLEVRGAGILGFEGLDNTRVYAAPLAEVADGYRVLLIDPEGGELRFEIQVEDVGMGDPIMHVVSAAGVDNLTQLTAGIETRVQR